MFLYPNQNPTFEQKQFKNIQNFPQIVVPAVLFYSVTEIYKYTREEVYKYTKEYNYFRIRIL